MVAYAETVFVKCGSPNRICHLLTSVVTGDGVVLARRLHRHGEPRNRSVPHPSRGRLRARRETASPQPEGEGTQLPVCPSPCPLPEGEGSPTQPFTSDGSVGRWGFDVRRRRLSLSLSGPGRPGGVCILRSLSGGPLFSLSLRRSLAR